MQKSNAKESVQEGTQRRPQTDYEHLRIAVPNVGNWTRHQDILPRRCRGQGPWPRDYWRPWYLWESKAVKVVRMRLV